jgi:hypothetical protein
VIDRLLRWLPWGILVLIVVLYVAGFLVAQVAPLTEEESDPLNVLWVFSFLGFGVVGVLILTRLPAHKLGWVLVAIPLAAGLAIFTGTWSRYALITRDGDVPFGEPAAWISAWIFQAAILLIIQLVILFPRGSARSRAWRRISVATTCIASVLAVLYAFRPGPLDGARPLHNPYGIDAWGDPINAVIPPLGLVLGLIFIAAIVDKIFWYRRARGIERQQLKWFALSPVALVLMFLGAVMIQRIVGSEANLIVLAFFPGFTAIAASIGIAVFKHRLYDIDVIVNRTVVYVLLTGLLALAYLGAIAVLQPLATELTGQGDIAVAASTLAVAALFAPLRKRVQDWIDHLFYRRRYDANRALDQFAGKLRDEIDLDSLTKELLEVVDDTMKPLHASLWLRPTVGEPVTESAPG